jgi:hypothetical protein
VPVHLPWGPAAIVDTAVAGAARLSQAVAVASTGEASSGRRSSDLLDPPGGGLHELYESGPQPYTLLLASGVFSAG